VVTVEFVERKSASPRLRIRWSEFAKQRDHSRGPLYALEVSVNKIHTLKVLRPLGTIDKLWGTSVLIRCRGEPSRTNRIHRDSLDLMSSVISVSRPLGDHECVSEDPVEYSVFGRCRGNGRSREKGGGDMFLYNQASCGH